MTAIVRRRACATCPFRKSAPGYFEPEVLDASVGDNLRQGYAHRCHKTLGAPRELVCGGFAAFAKAQGLDNTMLTVAKRMDLYDPASLEEDPDLEISSWEAVMEMHRRRRDGP